MNAHGSFIHNKPNLKQLRCLFIKNEFILWYEFLEQEKLIYGGKNQIVISSGVSVQVGLGKGTRGLSAVMVIDLDRGLGYIGLCTYQNSTSIYLIF